MKRLRLIVPLICVVFSFACDEKSNSDSAVQPASTTSGAAAKPASEPASKPTGDAAELTEMSEKIVAAIASKDVGTIVSYMPEKKREKTKKSLSPGGDDHEAFFGADSTEFQLATAAKGKVGPVRVKDGKDAWVKYGEKDGEVFVFAFEKEGDKWTLRGFRSPGREDFESWGN